MNTLPLLPVAPADAVLAYRLARPVSREEFLREVLALAQRLPGSGSLLNLCVDRYWFAVGFFAAVARGLVNLLPNSGAPEHLAAVRARAIEPVCLSDQEVAPIAGLSYIRVGNVAQTWPGTAQAMPRIPFDQVAALVFTSGSTGQPQPHVKTFGRLQSSASTEAARLWALTGGPCAVVGTVAFKHMYGLESTVLLPLLGGGQLTSRLPFYPADVVQALAELPAPRLLVTTPFHLRKLLEAELVTPPIAALLSATAPLSPALALRAETLLGPILEIYGSTETGQMATRRPCLHSEWQTFDGVTLAQTGDATLASGGHLEGAQLLNDDVELLSPTRFRLIDRKSNMINIVGKRSSLEFLNHVLAHLPGVLDGAFCLPDGKDGRDDARLAAFVVAPGLMPADVLAALRPHLDPVFLPRPIVTLQALPRDANGKIPASAMAALMAEHIPPRSRQDHDIHLP